MRQILSPLLSALTVTGGHFYNRRLDVGLLFFVLLLFAGLAFFYTMPVLFWLLGPDPERLSAVMPVMTYALPVPAAVLWLISVIVSFAMARNAVTRPSLSKVGVTAGVLTVTLSIATAIMLLTLSLNYLQVTEPESVSGGETAQQEEGTERSWLFASPFRESVRFGGKWVDLEKLTSLPRGEAFLTGRIQYEDMPAVGVTLEMVIDGRYRSGRLTTDDDGMFSLAVPPGQWLLNRIEISGWKDRPDQGDFSIVGGPNPSLTDAMFHDGPSFRSPGMPLKAAMVPSPLPGLNLTIRPRLDLRWPTKQSESADRDSSRFAWSAAESASRYQLQLHRIETDGASTTYEPVAWINTSETGVPLKSFRTVRTAPNEETEYAIKVFAFDRKDQLLSYSNEFFFGPTIVLRGAEIVETRMLRSLTAPTDLTTDEFSAQVETRYRDRKRLEAARTLAGEGLTNAARALLERIESADLDDDKAAVAGLLLASEGRCDEARAKQVPCSVNNMSLRTSPMR